jgi:phage tail sheath protein FI
MTMPEYLAPGVYVEEVATGAQPIEGVSTSTASFIGMAERGPVNVPILCTSVGDYANWFGGLLNHDAFADQNDATRSHCYLPYAVQGFFINGGKRVFVERVLPDAATYAHRDMYNRGAAGDLPTVLLRAAQAGSGTGATTPLLALNPPNTANTSTIRIGDGSASEYLDIVNQTAATNPVVLDRPLSFAHASGAGVNSFTPTAQGDTYTLAQATNSGATQVVLTSPTDLTVAANKPDWIVVVGDGVPDPAQVAPANAVALGSNRYRIMLTTPLSSAHAANVQVNRLTTAPSVNFTLSAPVAAGDSVLLPSQGVPAGDFLVIDTGTAQEVRQAGLLTELSLFQPPNRLLPANTIIAAASVAAAVLSTTLSADVAAGAQVVSLAGRSGLEVGMVIEIGSAPNVEYATVVAVNGERSFAPDPGSVALASPLDFSWTSGATVQVFAVPQPAPQLTPVAALTRLLFDSPAGANGLITTWGSTYVAGGLVRVTTPDGAVSYATVAAAPSTPFSPTLVSVDPLTPLQRSHAMGATVVPREALFTVQALDKGAWGRRLAISVQDEAPGLVSRAQVTGMAAPLQLTLATLTGVEHGSYLELFNLATGNAVDATPLKVRTTDPSKTTVNFDHPLTAAQIAAVNAALASPPDPTKAVALRSREFSLTVLLYRQPDPAVPSRNQQIIQTEVFRNLSMDHRHSRYFQRVIGDIDGAPRLSDGRPEGESNVIRVHDEAATAAATEAARLGPEPLIDHLPGGLTRPARHLLDQEGDDAVAAMNDQVYLGVDDPDPIKRTGLAALRNISQISLVAIPGQATPAIHGALIAHCENSLYRFAVLDPARSDASLADIQAQRQAFDSKYAALYYPWLTIPDPMPVNLAAIGQFPLPPSGHITGIYARVDDQRGVHKAPANEVVLGITDLTRRLTKGEQDILNPSPVNINVIRDFRHDGRSIRVWGARCITSDTDYKYVPVRRLLIFIEQSIDLGLQWVVFEPNARPLWGRVRRSVTNFLTDVWRSGALEGAKVEEAFFVRCDETTMTQTDIDNGRLIILIGVAPVKPAEYVIIRIGLMTAGGDQ